MTFLFLFFDGPAYIKLHPSQKGKYTQKNNKKKFVALSSNVNKIERAKLNRWPLFSPLLILLLLSNAFCKHIENCTRAERKWKRRETHRSILFLLRLEKKREFLKIIKKKKSPLCVVPTSSHRPNNVVNQCAAFEHQKKGWSERGFCCSV